MSPDPQINKHFRFWGVTISVKVWGQNEVFEFENVSNEDDQHKDLDDDAGGDVDDGGDREEDCVIAIVPMSILKLTTTLTMIIDNDNDCSYHHEYVSDQLDDHDHDHDDDDDDDDDDDEDEDEDEDEEEDEDENEDEDDDDDDDEEVTSMTFALVHRLNASALWPSRVRQRVAVLQK